MADGFEAMVDAALPFFAELAENNSKAWFDPRKAHYTAEIKKPAELLGDLIAEDLSRITGRSHKAKLFRIYRDVRFSKDKTPLNAHLHVMWSDSSGAEGKPVWFFGLSPTYFLMGTGLMTLSGPNLTRFRAHIDANGADLQAALEDAAPHGVQISDWGPEPLKRVPKPYAPDHLHGDLLRRKALAVHMPIPADWRSSGLIKALNTSVGRMLPVAERLTL